MTFAMTFNSPQCFILLDWIFLGLSLLVCLFFYRSLSLRYIRLSLSETGS